MSLRRRALLFGYPALELLTLWLLGQWLGWEWALLAFLGGVPIGLALMASAGRAAVDDARRAAASGLPAGRTMAHGVRFACGLLLAIPGVWSDLVALMVLIPAAQRYLLKRYERALGGSSWWGARVTVIRGDVMQGSAGPVKDRKAETGRAVADVSRPVQAPADQRGGAWSAGAIDGPATPDE